MLRLPTIRAQFPELVEAADDKHLTKTIARYGRLDLLCADLCRSCNYAEACAV